MPTCKFVSGTGFEVAFKLLRFGQSRKSTIEINDPRGVFGRRIAVPGIVFSKAPLKVGCRADVMLIRIINTDKAISIIHK